MQHETENLGGVSRWESQLKKKKLCFADWSRKFSQELKVDRLAANALKELTAYSKGAHAVLLELLFNEVSEKFGFGTDPRDWNAFKSKVVRTCREASLLSAELQRLSKFQVFKLPVFALPTFVSREQGKPAWRQTSRGDDFFLAPAAASLQRAAEHMQTVIGEGNKRWSIRDYRRLNTVLLSLYVHRVSGKWHDLHVAMLVRAAYKCCGMQWRSERNPEAAIGELRRRFQRSEARANSLWLNRSAKSKQQAIRKANLYNDLRALVSDFVHAAERNDAEKSLLEFINDYFLYSTKLQKPYSVRDDVQ